MTVAHVDPDRLADFRHDLQRFIQSEHDLIAELRAHAVRLGSTWRDRQYSLFMDEFEERTRRFISFLEVLNDDFIPHLQRREEEVRTYLEGNGPQP